VLGLSGYAGVFCGNSPSYRAVFPEMPARAGSCATTGVLGTAVGVMGTIQAHLTLSLILGLQPSIAAQLVTIDFRSFRFGGFNFASAPEPKESVLRFIARTDVTATDITVDLRSAEEAAEPAFGSSLRVLPHEIERVASDAVASRRVVLCCRSGVRAWQAAARLRTRGLTNLALIALGD
jgi:rhodanese-related sulfurtransferase